MDSSDARQIRLDEPQRIFPHRAGQLDHAIQPAEYRIIVALRRSPTIVQPRFFVFRKRHDAAHFSIGQIQLRQPLQSIQQRERYKVQIRQLIGHCRLRAQQRPDGFHLPVALVDQPPPPRFLLDLFDQVGQLPRLERIKHLAHPAIQAQPAQTKFFQRR